MVGVDVFVISRGSVVSLTVGEDAIIDPQAVIRQAIIMGVRILLLGFKDHLHKFTQAESYQIYGTTSHPKNSCRLPS
jgi:hypothetical protein